MTDLSPAEPNASKQPPGTPNGTSGRALGLRIGLAVLGILVFLLVLPALGLPLLFQDSLTYFPRRYDGEAPSEEFGSPFRLYRTADGIDQWGYRIDPPAGAPAVSEGLPDFYLVFYGNGSLSAEVAEVFEYFAQQTGCGFFIVDYRGYGFNAGRPSERGLTDDALGAYDTLEAAGDFRRGVGVIGHSLGGAVSIALAEKRHVDRLLALSTFTSVRDVARETMPAPVAMIVRNDWPSEQRLKQILSRPADERPSAIGLIHGARDEVIPVEMSRRLARLPGEGIELLIHPQASHNDIFEYVAPEIIGFLKGESIERDSSSKKG